MKKALVSVLRLTTLVGVLVLLPFISKGPVAQLGHQCVTFFTDSFECPSCGCTKTGTFFLNNAYAVDKTTGMQSILNTDWSCGTPVAGCGTVACSGTYPQAVSDSGCCIVEGSACATNEPCCPGTVCTSTGCTACQTDCPYPLNGCIPCGQSPIILDLNGNGFHLTSAANGVKFDISGSGNVVQMGWTAQGADNAFLALPGADGLVHNGKELFGNFTPQPASNTPNGFAALAVYDQPASGGNGDGVIDSRDAVFSSLRLWIDTNHDGICQPGELHTLPSLGVNSISLKYKLSEKADQYGNLFRYRAAVNPDDPDASRVDRKGYDVFFVTLNSSGTP
jgi:hypothetical protein